MKTKAKAPSPDAHNDVDPLEDYIPISEAAKRLRVGTEAARRLGRTKRFKMIKFVGRHLVSKTSLDAFIKRELELAQQQ